MLKIETIVSTPFEENTYVVTVAQRTDCVVIDAGLEPDKIIALLERLRLTPAAILCTHGHSDHIAGNALLKQRWPDCPLAIGAGDAQKLTDARQNLSAAYGISITSPPADELLSEGDRYQAAGMDLEVLETPGHSSGHIVFVCRQDAPIRIFGGDVLFAGSVGRTDFPDSDGSRLVESIRSKLFAFPDDTIVYPGHGPVTTIGQEKRTNPFVGRGSGLGE